MVLRRSRSRRRRLGHASMEDGAAPNALSKCCVTKTKVEVSSLPPKKKKKKKSLCLGFSRLGFRFVCLFGFGFFPWIFFSFVRRKSPLFSSHFGSPHASSWTTRVARGGRRGVVVVCRRRSFCFAFCVVRTPTAATDTFFVVVVFIHARTHL